MSEDGTSGSLFTDLKPRLIAAAVFAVLSFVFLWLGGAYFAAFMALITGVMLAEYTRMVAPECDLASRPGWCMILGGALAVLALAFSPLWFFGLGALGLILAAILNARRLGAITCLGYAYILCASGAAVFLRETTGGFAVVLWLVGCVAAADIGGYAFGRLLQGPKLMPSVSPKKTWSGFLGGLALACIIAIIFGLFSGGAIGTLILFGVVLGTVSVAGDLIESSVKRRFGVKDTGTILPGHGGLLDRLDGMAAAMLVFGFLSLMFDLGPWLSPNYVPVLTGGGL